jgi:mono/diheme cytochrome c family protein
MRQRVPSAVYGTLLAGSVLVFGGVSVAITPSSPPAVPAQAEPKKDDPAALFSRLGCALCHAPGARYHDRILKAAGKSEQDLAKWIRNPEQFVPGTTMPTYASLIDEPSALALARWIKSGGPQAGK